MSEHTLQYCPVCAAPLIEKHVFNAQRLACTACDFIFFLNPKLVAVVVVCHEGKVLLGRRTMSPGKGMWSFFGGYVDRGETVEGAARREVKEETNLDVNLEQLVGVYSEAGSPHVLIAYQASIVNNEVGGLTAQPEEVSELAFFSWEALPDLAFPVDTQILIDLKRIAGSKLERE